MSNFTTRKTFLMPSFDLDLKERDRIDRFLLLLERSGVESLFPNDANRLMAQGGRPSMSHHNLLALILYGFAFGSTSLRDLEESCRYDLRFIYLSEQGLPKHSTFGNFINEVVVPNRDRIFSLVTKAIMDECGLPIRDTFIDGTKFEADANRYKFVWKPTANHLKLSDSIRTLLRKHGLHRNVPSEGFIESGLIASRLNELKKLADSGEASPKDCRLLYGYLARNLEYEEKERICGDRNSYYKSDHDATAMALKVDYYSGHGSNMRAAYNSQIIVSSGIICSYYTSQSRTDVNDFIPAIEKFHEFYGFYPERVCADAGYGSLGNYRYLDEHGIGNFVKHRSWEGNVSGRRPDEYVLNGDMTITCLEGRTGYPVSIPARHPKSSKAGFYRIEGCGECGFRYYCKRNQKEKDGDFRVFEVSKDLAFYKQEAERNLLSAKGIEMRVNRSSQVEGAFGIVKQDMNYTRARRTSLERVETEHMLIYLGYNIRKLFRFYDGKAKFSYWVAPEGLQPEKMKKPSAKRLTNKYKKKEAV